MGQRPAAARHRLESRAGDSDGLFRCPGRVNRGRTESPTSAQDRPDFTRAIAGAIRLDPAGPAAYPSRRDGLGRRLGRVYWSLRQPNLAGIPRVVILTDTFDSS